MDIVFCRAHPTNTQIGSEHRLSRLRSKCRRYFRYFREQAVEGEWRFPAGRADDFAWPRRTVPPVGADPVVATADLPMTPMVAERGSATAAAPEAIAAATPVAPQPPRRIRSAEYQQLQYRPDFFRPFNFFPFLFGGGR
jgi:hypothetical protein